MQWGFSMKINFKLCILYIFLILVVVIGCYSIYAISSAPPVTTITDVDDNEEILDLVETNDEFVIPEIDYDAEELLKQNKDFKGWLYIPDTNISRPVVQGTDNAYYLNHAFTGKQSAYGCLFFDTASVEGSRNRVIYGHNMGNQRTEMFSTLVEYQDQAYAENHRYIYYAENNTTNCYEVFAVVNFNINKINEFDYRKANFKTEDEFNTFVSYLTERSEYATEFSPESDLLILSTCNGVYGRDNRLIICCGLIQ